MFNRVWKHFVVKKSPKAMAHDGFCTYRNADGDRCAIGLFIPDRVYSKDLESTRINSLLESHSASALRLRRHFSSTLTREARNRYFLTNLQELHDGAPRPFHRRIEKRLRDFAWRYDLKVPKR